MIFHSLSQSQKQFVPRAICITRQAIPTRFVVLPVSQGLTWVSAEALSTHLGTNSCHYHLFLYILTEKAKRQILGVGSMLLQPALGS